MWYWGVSEMAQESTPLLTFVWSKEAIYTGWLFVSEQSVSNPDCSFYSSIASLASWRSYHQNLFDVNWQVSASLILYHICSLRSHFCVTCCKQRWQLGITSPTSVCLSVCLSFRLPVLSVTLFRHTSLFCNNSSFTYTI